MSESMPENILAEIRQGLDHTQAERRLKSLERLRSLSYGSKSILRKLEQMAVHDRSKRVRAEAFDILKTPLYRQVQERNTNLSLQARQIVADEITQWEKEGLLNDMQSQTLHQRYAFNLKPAAVAQLSTQAKEAPAKEKQTLGQTLLSETSIKIALYLGAFFVVAAAMIFAAVIEELRLPILLFFTLLFGAGSLLIKKKLHQPSFTLFIVFSVLLPIDFSVFSDFLNLQDSTVSVYWMSVFGLMALIWTFAIWFFRSRFFSILAFLSLSISLLFFADLFSDPPIDLHLLMLSFSGLLALLGVRFLKKWQDEKFPNPLFFLAQFQQVVVLFISCIAFLIRHDGSAVNDYANIWWLATTAIWFLATVFYFFLNWIKKSLFFCSLAVLSLMPLAWLFVHIFDAGWAIEAISLIIWGTVFALSGESLYALKTGKFYAYGQPLIFGAAPLVGMASILGLSESVKLGFVICLSGAVLYTLLTLYRLRLWTWSLALVAVLSAYFIFFELDAVSSWDLYFGFKLLFPSLLLLLPDFFLKNDFKDCLNWRLPPRLLGFLIVLVNIMGMFTASEENYLRVAVIFIIYALIALGYALRYFPQFAYLTNGALVLAIIYILRDQDATRWLVTMISLTILYYLIGLTLERVRKYADWSSIYRYSGLCLGAFVAISAPFEDSGLAASLPVVIAAMLFTVEAFKKRNIWLGFPANALYLMAYFMILINFEVDQPQLFSVAAAVLGMLMHYLLVRSGNKIAAFITGMLSQFILLSTTYFQMLSEEELIYFVVLFFQALAVLVYGIVIRSRSLVITPIFVLVVGVLTIAFGLLEGLPTILLIGCTGVFLIAFGIGALLLREKVSDLRERLDAWNA